MINWLFATGNGLLATALVMAGIVLLMLLMTRCGGNGSSPPAYNDQGVCVANCPNDNGTDNGVDINGTDGKDGSVNDQSDVNGGDQTQTDVSTEETVAYVCPDPANPPEVCKPKEYKEAYCGGGYCSSGEHQSCLTDAECQQVPADKWPPCVCWEFCGFISKWQCPSSVWEFKGFLPDEGDGLCHFDPQGGYPILGKPGDPNVRYPLEGEPKESFVLSPDGEILTSLTSGVKCQKKSDE